MSRHSSCLCHKRWSRKGTSSKAIRLRPSAASGERDCDAERRDALLPFMLPEGAKLHIYGPDSFRKTYVGLPD